METSSPGAGIPTPRLATADDSVEVAGLLHDFNSEFDTPSPGPQVLTSRLRSLLGGDATFAVLAGSPAVAVALATLRPNVWCAGPVALLDESTSYRTFGVAASAPLLEFVVSVSRSRGVDLIEIYVDEGDVDERRFYERHRFSSNEQNSTERALYYSQDLAR